ncbi:hypothetical protein BG011_009930 [Mortierella polycephala]|uniref:Uncharacterized protein n=1 Tax=Mortierella polycephala TaxID=41804 RepID=A0A9P6TVC1_9FUNG|nr:hypothetical protein BG011_009930 [Mortierella polycephala]
MARFSNTVLLFSLLLVQLSHHLVQAGYTFQAPTAATRWVAGQPGLVTIVSTDKAKANTKVTDRLLTITLRNDRNTAAVIKDGLQLLVPAGSAEKQVSWTLDWVVPADMPGGLIYSVHLERAKDGFFDLLPDKEKTAIFQIDANVPPSPTPGTTMTPTATLTPTANSTTTLVPTPTPTPILPPAQTCNDIKEQCAAQGKSFLEATDTTPCSCGESLIIPTIIKKNAATGGIKSTVSSFQSTGGPTAAFAFMLLVVMTIF